MSKSIIETIEVQGYPPQEVYFRPKFKTLCRIGEEPFLAFAKIRYMPAMHYNSHDELWYYTLLEFSSVEEYLKSLKHVETTIEEVSRLVFDELRRVLGDIPIIVEIEGRTTVHAPAGAITKQGDWQ